MTDNPLHSPWWQRNAETVQRTITAMLEDELRGLFNLTVAADADPAPLTSSWKPLTTASTGTPTVHERRLSVELPREFSVDIEAKIDVTGWRGDDARQQTEMHFASAATALRSRARQYLIGQLHAKDVSSSGNTLADVVFQQLARHLSRPSVRLATEDVTVGEQLLKRARTASVEVIAVPNLQKDHGCLGYLVIGSTTTPALTMTDRPPLTISQTGPPLLGRLTSSMVAASFGSTTYKILA